MCTYRSDDEPVLGKDFSQSCILLPWNNSTRCYEVLPSDASSQSVPVGEALNLCCQKNSVCFLDAGRLSCIFGFQIQHQFSTVTIDSTYYINASSYCFNTSSAELVLSVGHLQLSQYTKGSLSGSIARTNRASASSCPAFTVMLSRQNGNRGWRRIRSAK